MSKTQTDVSQDGSAPVAEVPMERNPPTELAVATVRTVDLDTAKTRSEHDLLGDGDVPADALWGIHTKRAVTNFPITGVPVGHFPEFVRGLALVKQAAARANKRLGYLDATKAESPRDFRRLQLLRDWSHDEAYPTLFP